MEIFEENIGSKESYGFINNVRFICITWTYIRNSVWSYSSESYEFCVATIPGSEAGAGPFI